MLSSLILSLALASPLLSNAHAAEWPDLGTAPAGATADGANDVALVIAIGDYVFESLPDIPGAKENGEAWRRYLKDVRGVSVVTLLADEEATKEDILRTAERLRARLKPGGRFWVVFVGHGAPSMDGREGLLVGADAKGEATSLYARSLAQSELLRATGAEEGVNVVAFVDACFSGSATGSSHRQALARGLQPYMPVGLLRTPQGRSATLLTAGRDDQFAGSLPGLERPAFSWLALGALRGWGDANRDGEVSAQELTDYVADRMVELVKGRKQEPQLAGDANIALGRGKEKAPNLQGLVAAGAPAARASVNAPPATPTGGSSTVASVDDDIAALLRVKEMKAAREKKLTELADAKQVEAAEAWRRLSEVLGEGTPEEIAAVKKFVRTWTDAKVWVGDAEGRHERVVAVSALDSAKGWLERAKASATRPSAKSSKVLAVANAPKATPKGVDADKDGVLDTVDACPAVPEDIDAYSDTDGCPEPTEVTIKIMDSDGHAVTDGVWRVGEAIGKHGEVARLSAGGATIAVGSVQKAYTVPTGAPTEVTITVPSPRGGLVVNIVDKHGKAVPNATWSASGPTDLKAQPAGTYTLRPGAYMVSAAAPGFKKVVRQSGVQKDGTITLQFEMVPAKAELGAGKIEIRDSVYFETGKAIIKPESFGLLDEIAAILKDHPELTKLRIEGHTDARGDNAANKQLSQERAESVMKYLTEKGIAAGRVEAMGYGEEKPLVRELTDADRARNRRVDFFVAK